MSEQPKTPAEAQSGRLLPVAPGSAKTSDQEQERRRNIIGGIYLESDSCSDNLAVALMCYFTHHIENPDDGQEDDYGNDKWASEKTEEALNRIAETIWPNDRTDRRGRSVTLEFATAVARPRSVQ